MKSHGIAMIGGSFWTPKITQITALKTDKGLLIGSTTHFIGSTEGLIGNQLPVKNT